MLKILLNESLFEILNEEVIKPTDNSYHDVWYLDDRYAVHNDGGKFHVIDRANGNNYLLNSDSIDEVNDYIKNNLNLDMSIEPSSRQFKKKANIDSNKNAYLKSAAEMGWESGHPFDPDDFSYFKRVCKEDGYNVNEKDFQKYWEYFDECKAKQFADDDDDIDTDLGPWEEMDSKQVEDSDGFMTDYTWYVKDNDDGSETHVMIFGDQDLYNPLNSEPDAEFDSEERAEEWFNNYRGFEDDDDESYLNEAFSPSLPYWLVDYIQENKEVSLKLAKTKHLDLANMEYTKLSKDDIPIQDSHPLLKDETKQLVYLLRDNRKNIVYLPGISPLDTQLYIDPKDNYRSTSISRMSLKRLLNYVVSIGYIDKSKDSNLNISKQKERKDNIKGTISRGEGQYQTEIKEYPKDEYGRKNYDADPIISKIWVNAKNQDKSGYLLNPNKYKNMLDQADLKAETNSCACEVLPSIASSKVSSSSTLS